MRKVRAEANAKPWEIAAIKQEENKRPRQLWVGEPSFEAIEIQQIKLIRFLRKHGKRYPDLLDIADILDACTKDSRCCSGACRECGRLFQRQYARLTQRAVKSLIVPQGTELIAICAVPTGRLIRTGQLHKFSPANFQRQVKTALDKAGVKCGIGGIDYSFNEHENNEWDSFICPHIYFITSTDDRKSVGKTLRERFKNSDEVKRPVKLSKFENIRKRISYSYKIIFKRRISVYETEQKKDGSIKRVRNTRYDRPRVNERIELYRHLHAVGFAARVIFRGIKPEQTATGVRFRKA